MPSVGATMNASSLVQQKSIRNPEIQLGIGRAEQLVYLYRDDNPNQRHRLTTTPFPNTEVWEQPLRETSIEKSNDYQRWQLVRTRRK